MTSHPVEANALCWWLHPLPAPRRLHAVPVAQLDPADEDAFEELTGSGLMLRTVCGWRSPMGYPGPFSRLGMARCGHCCKRLGIATGNGTPANEAGRSAA